MKKIMQIIAFMFASFLFSTAVTAGTPLCIDTQHAVPHDESDAHALLVADEGSGDVFSFLVQYSSEKSQKALYVCNDILLQPR